MTADVSHLYPPSPANVPPDLTRPSESYRTRVVIVLASLFVFVVIYLGLTIGSAYTCYYCIAWLAEEEPKPTYTQPASQPGGRAGRGVRNHPAATERPPKSRSSGSSSAGSSPALLCLFLVKGLFKRSRRRPGRARRGHRGRNSPTLFAFIRQLCKDTGAPVPAQVFLTPDVNAAVVVRRVDR